MKSAPRSPATWHRRFQRQAAWTLATRQYLFQLAGLNSTSRVLEIGCGTGAVLENFFHPPVSLLAGVDLNINCLHFAQKHNSNPLLIAADANRLPFSSIFDIVFSHFFFLWQSDPLKLLNEMKRVTRQGGCILAMAEPDYLARIDFPPSLEKLGRLQTKQLEAEGANLHQGRDLAGYFRQARLNNIRFGVISGEWCGNLATDEWEDELDAIRSDLQSQNAIPVSSLELLLAQARKDLQRLPGLIFIPTFYAIGWV